MSSFCEETDTYSPAAIEPAPAARPARPVSTIVCAVAPPAPTPAISDTLVTSPSMAPNTAGRSQPPDTSRWWCPPSCGCDSVLACFSVAIGAAFPLRAVTLQANATAERPAARARCGAPRMARRTGRQGLALGRVIQEQVPDRG